MKQSGQAIRESAWRIAVESWLRSRGYIRPHIKTKVSPNFSSLLAHEQVAGTKMKGGGRSLSPLPQSTKSSLRRKGRGKAGSWTSCWEHHEEMPKMPKIEKPRSKKNQAQKTPGRNA
jgi:hypothetical protein